MQYIVLEKNLYAFLINEESDDGAEIVRLSPYTVVRIQENGVVDSSEKEWGK